ncbi:phosphate/phosphite/phosphonate ABC transporter substrate-binding protein [Phenylobacterium sp.]|uniref:phosphate/phosphite/phosphonate ABC transporter substrate-binding protein n=1 Tax=Phenylobacterium sp. TaxID=1871053 RepID=UPI00286C9D84|nr:phosphate/phosphite/phosphonate ABC transporter substrate-binding protein [Phenylobacterium sp.]
MIDRRLLLASGLASLGLSACGKQEAPASGAEPAVINFSILATENSTSMATFWTPILADMEKSIGIPVKPFFASNYTALIEALRFKQVDAGWFSNLSGLEAVRRANGEVFARTFDPSNIDGYKSVIIVPANSKTTLEDVLRCDKSLSFGIGDAKSTSGTLAPMTYLFAPRNIDPAKCFRAVKAANHQANLFSVAKGVLDVATNNSTAIRLQRERGSPVADQVRVIWESPKLPEDPIIWRSDLDPAVKEKLRRFFLTYAQGEGAEPERQRKLLNALSIGGFKPADATHLLPVQEMEATEALLEARNKGDRAKMEQAQKSLDAIKAERAAIEAKTGQPAAAL